MTTGGRGEKRPGSVVRPAAHPRLALRTFAISPYLGLVGASTLAFFAGLTPFSPSFLPLPLPATAAAAAGAASSGPSSGRSSRTRSAHRWPDAARMSTCGAPLDAGAACGSSRGSALMSETRRSAPLVDAGGVVGLKRAAAGRAREARRATARLDEHQSVLPRARAGPDADAKRAAKGTGKDAPGSERSSHSRSDSLERAARWLSRSALSTAAAEVLAAAPGARAAVVRRCFYDFEERGRQGAV